MTLRTLNTAGALLSGCAVLLGAPARAGATARAAEEMPALFGSVIYADGWTTQQNEVGMYSIPTSAGMGFTRLSPAYIDASAGGVAVDGTYWACCFVDYLGTPFVMVSGYDTGTWEETSFRYADTGIIATGVAYDPVSRQVYGCFRNDTNTGYVFGTVDYTTLTRTRICDLPCMWSAVAADRHGTVYAIDETGNLYTVDKGDGTMTFTGHTGLTASHPSSACIDYRTGRMFYALTSAPEGSLYEIDTLTAEPTLVYRFPGNEEVTGMFLPLPEADDLAPDSPSGMDVSFDGPALQGTLTFTAPTVCFNGTPGSGALSYTLEANGVRLLRASCAWGEEVAAEVAVPEAGAYEFSLYLTTQAGDGPSMERSVYAGPDTPLAPEFTLGRDGDLVTLALSPVTATVHGGYADLAGMRYEVTRLPDNTAVAADTDGLTFRDLLPAGGELRAYRYSVRALYGDGASGAASDTALTAKLWTGAAALPWTSVADNFEATEPYTVADANGDGVTWSWNEENRAFFTSFNRRADNDDWLITPALDMQKGRVYKVTVTLRTYLGNPEEYEIACGPTPDAAGMTHLLKERTRIKARQAEDVTVYLAPDTDGPLHIGIHGVTPADDAWYLYVDAVTVDAGVTQDVPAAPSGLTVEPDFGGALSAAVTVTAPSVSDSGAPLESLDRLDVCRDGEPVHCFERPAPGATLVFTDTPSAAGYHTYTAAAFNAHGAGRTAECRVFVGVNSPARPAWAHIEETAAPGEVKVTWERVTTAADGSPLNPGLVSYDLMTVDDTHGGEAYNAAEGVTGAECVLTVPGAATQQRFAYYAVKAVTATDYSLMTLTPMLPVGPAYATPYAESFGGGRARTLMRPDNGAAMWSVYDDSSGIPAHDGDHGMAAMYGELDGAEASLYSGKISLRGAAHPVLTFYTYNIAGDEPDLNELYVSVGTGTEFAEVCSVVTGEYGDTEGWYPVTVPLDAYAGREIQIAFRGVTRNRKFTLLDDITVADGTALNLKAGNLSAPASAEPGREFTITATVENTGRGDAEDSLVTLFVNGGVAADVHTGPVEAGRTATVQFVQTFNAVSEPVNTYSFTVTTDGDECYEDNTSASVTVTVDFADVPAPENLRCEGTRTGVTLQWDEPDRNAMKPARTTESFETWDPWSKEGQYGWTFVDGDGCGIGAVQNVQFPGIDYNSELAWFVLDSSAEGLGADYAAASGDKYLSTFFCLPLGDFQYVPNDDWAVSPLLYGGAQRVTLTARSVNEAVAAESFEILYAAEDSCDPARFIPLEHVDEVPGAWTAYAFDLPEGALRFAVRYDTNYGLMLHVDDISFIPAGETDLRVAGYNVYRDGILLTDSPVAECIYVDPIFPDNVEYRVSAVYTDGSESRACDPVVLKTYGIGGTEPDGVTLTLSEGALTVTGAEGRVLTLYSAAGHTVLQRLCGAAETLRPAPGIYLAAIGGRVWKVAL